MELISTQTVGAGGAAQIVFNNIPQTFTDLILVSSCRALIPNFSNLVIWFNAYGSSTYSDKNLFGYGAGRDTNSNSSGTGQASLGTIAPTDSTAGTFSNSATYISNYSSNSAKSFSTDSVNENNGTTAYQHILASSSTLASAITQINIGVNGTGGSNGIAQYSTFSLYGITKGSGGATAA